MEWIAVCSKMYEWLSIFSLIVFSCSLSHFWKIYWWKACENSFSCNPLLWRMIERRRCLSRLFVCLFTGHTSNASICKFSQLKANITLSLSARIMTHPAEKAYKLNLSLSKQTWLPLLSNFLINLLIAINFFVFCFWKVLLVLCIDSNWVECTR